MALVKSKKKIEGGWSYRGFELHKTDTANWNVSKVNDEIEMNDNIELFLSNTHKQLTATCTIIDGLYDGEAYSPKKTKSVKERETDTKLEESWGKFYNDARTKKGTSIFNEIIRDFKGLHFGEHRIDTDKLGNITFKWLPVNTDFAIYQSYPAWNQDVLEEIQHRFREIANITFLDSYRLQIEILLDNKSLSDFVLGAIR